MSLDLRTGRYADFQADQGIAVQISVGKPRFRLGFEIAAACWELAPLGLLAVDDDDEFDRLYIERLDRFGVDRVLARLGEIAAEHGGRPLVLLCFEDLGQKPCHRRLAAWWLEQRTGLVVPEVAPAQLTFDSKEQDR